MKKKEEIPLCEFDGDPNEKSEIRLWFECPKCHKKIWNHLYNEHVHNCKKNVIPSNRYKNKNKKIKNQPTAKKFTKRRLVNLPMLNTSKTRHRRKPIKK